MEACQRLQSPPSWVVWLQLEILLGSIARSGSPRMINHLTSFIFLCSGSLSETSESSFLSCLASARNLTPWKCCYVLLVFGSMCQQAHWLRSHSLWQEIDFLPYMWSLGHPHAPHVGACVCGKLLVLPRYLLIRDMHPPRLNNSRGTARSHREKAILPTIPRLCCTLPKFQLMSLTRICSGVCSHHPHFINTLCMNFHCWVISSKRAVSAIDAWELGVSVYAPLNELPKTLPHKCSQVGLSANTTN